MKKMLVQWLSKVKYSHRAKLLDVNPEDTCYFQGTRETLVDSTLIKIGEGIIGEALVPDTRGAAEVVSEGEDTEVSKSKDYHHGYFSKGIDDESIVCLLSLKPNCTLFQKQKRKVLLCISGLYTGNQKTD